MISNRNFKVPTTRELFKCVINRKEWRSKSPLRKWSYLYGIGKSLCKVIKMPPYEEDQTLCWFAYFPVFYVSVHLILVVYTTVHYTLLGEYNKFLPCTCIFFGPIFGVCDHFITRGLSFKRRMQNKWTNQFYVQITPVLYILYTKKRYILHDFMAFPGRYLYPDSVLDESEEFYDICSNQMDNTIKSFLCKMAILTTSASVAVTWASYQSFTEDVKVTAIQLKLPFVEENSYSEFIGNILIECNILGHGYLGYLSIEVGMDIVTDFVSISRKLLQYRLKNMIQEHQLMSSADTISSLGNIVQNLRNYDKYESTWKIMF